MKFETSFIEIIDKHIPIEKRKPVAYPVPYMNQNLRNVIYKKKMYHNKFLKQKTDKNWETYRKQRNLVTKLKKTSLFVLFVSILFILGWVLSILMFLSPISLTTFTKKLLNISVTSFGSFTILSFSHKIMLLFDFIVP
jgi:hypothetical protein